MKTLVLLICSLLFLATAPGARAQDSAWIQIEALRTLSEAEARARVYSGSLPNVAGFRAGRGWYAVALGPYTEAAAKAELSALKSRRQIPRDSYLAFGRDYGQQFWPVGANSLFAAPQGSQTALRAPQAQEEQPATALPEAPAYIPDETPREARANERLLGAEDRRLVQEALKWEGFYASTIDGAFGGGTRRAMADWQLSRGYDATGVLTTRQREELIGSYRAAFADLDLKLVSDGTAGIEMILPMGKIDPARTEAPFVHYDSSDEDGVRVLLISQSGDEATLFGLYDIMQTLEIVPVDGFRERKKDRFVLTGESPELKSHTYAALADGAVKGFTLIWKPGNEKVMARVVETMTESFTPLKGIVLPDNATSDAAAEQRIDLMAGLEIRRPERSRSGFFVDATGQVLTTTDVLGQCRRVTIGEEIEADVAARDDTLGVALIRPRRELSPLAVAAFHPSVPRLNSEIALSGFSYEDVLDLPVVTYGRLADIKGLQGETNVERLSLESLPGDAGGPVLDTSGAVLGMLRARSEDAARQLPPDVNFAVDVPAIADFLTQAGLSPRAADERPALAPEDLTTLAGDITVRVSCWN